MPKHDLPINVIIQALENDNYLTEALFFPEAVRLNDKIRKAKESLQANLRKLVEETPLVSIYQRHPAGEPEIGEVEVTLAPPLQSVIWRRPITLKLPIVRWSHGEFAQIAYIPPLGIEVVATTPPTRTALDKLVTQHIRAALGRSGALNSLGKLVWLQRHRDLKIERLSIEVSLLSPKQIAARNQERDENKQSVLAEAGTDLTKEKHAAAYEVDDIVAQLAEILTGRSPRSLLLIGRSGVGKTSVVYELARRRADFELGHTPFWATNGSRLIAGMSGFGQWQERCQKLWREAAQTRAILYLGNLIELMEVGKSIVDSQGIASFFRPYIARGDVLAISECTPEQFSLIERREPRLLEAFHQIRIEEPSPERSRNILLSLALAQSSGAQSEAGIELEAIERIDQLHRRYASYSAYPGRPVRFLKNLLQDHLKDGAALRALTAEDVTAAFSRETGLPRVLLDEREKLDLEATRSWFSSRVIGQPDAVDLTVDLLATVKAGLTRPRKPIASLLFIGPTGVGKTEMAKSLAEFLFQDRQRMVRFDMSEYADPTAVNRLIGGTVGSEGLLTARVREQPFAVVLLDEFEKAHPLFFDLLLQVLGEGRLTDAMGHVADFSNAVVIMTSNLGSEAFQRGLIGFEQAAATRQAASRHFINAVRQALRPEMFNRIDRIVPFAPLDEETVLQIAEREIERIKKRDGIHYRGAKLKIWGGVTEYLARRGYDARYGARPLKRLIERELLVPLSEKLNNQPRDVALLLNVWIENESLKFNVQPATEDSGKQAYANLGDRSLVDLARGCMHTRREAQLLESSPTALNLRNEIFTLEGAEKRLSRQKWKNPADLDRIAALPKLKTALNAINDFTAKIKKLEHEASLAVYGKVDADHSALSLRLVSAQSEWKELLISTYALRFKNPDLITVAVFSEEFLVSFALTGAYYQLAMNQGAGVEAYQFSVRRNERAKKTGVSLTLECERITAIESFLASPREGVIGIALGINAPFAFPRFEAERGLHQFTKAKKVSKCLVQTSEKTVAEYQAPAGIERYGAIGHQERRRSYNIDQAFIEDAMLRRRSPWSGRAIDEAIGDLIEECLMEQARTLIK
ncbi:MAG: AAA family ATPase [Acidobacteria bacterium]|nr:AAA family ATPase [Acidobacteriota bacterium]